MIKYNKLYQSLKKVSAEWHAGHVQWDYSWVYLKFYENGTCILGYIGNEEPASINTWFNEKHSNASKGVFHVTGNTITINFNTKVKNEGQIQGDKIILQSSSDINLAGTWDLFSLVE